MMHIGRIHAPSYVVETAEDLAERLTAFTWTICSVFKLGDYLYVNDSTSENGASEYAILESRPNEKGLYNQVESITFGWCKYEKALELIQKISSGFYTSIAVIPFKQDTDIGFHQDHCYMCR